MSITTYFKEVRGEMKHVSWPTRQMVVVYTAVVIGISLAVAAYLGLLDFAFSAAVQAII